MHLLSIELFGQSLFVCDFPKLKGIRGLGMSDKECYARILADKFDYTNTFYDCEPRFDFAEPHDSLHGSYDFILSADVLEHIERPIENALFETYSLLKPCGFFGVTVYCNPSDTMREHFPGLNEYRVVPLGDSQVLINRRTDGVLEIRDDLIFHGGTGATLEMREFGITALRARLCQAGFRDIELLVENVPSIGILFDSDVSQPLIARKEPYVMDACVRAQLVREWRREQERVEQLTEQLADARERVELARQSRWLRLGRMLGRGPDLDSKP